MIPALLAIIAIVLESWSSIWHSVDLFLKSQQLTVGAIITGMVPFFVIWNKLSKEKEKRIQAQRVEQRQLEIEQRQLRIESKIDDLMHYSGVESTWSLPEIGLKHTHQPNLKNWFSFLPKLSIQKRRMKMDKLKSRKFWLTILAALIPIINTEFGLNLDLGSIITIVSAIMAGVAALAHVDAKKILAGLVHTKVTVKGLEVAFTTFQEAIPYLKEIHADINKLLDDVKKDDGSQAFKDAMHAYAQIKPILDAIKHPEPLAVIVEDKVAS